jgi:hypothetical protein
VLEQVMQNLLFSPDLYVTWYDAKIFNIGMSSILLNSPLETEIKMKATKIIDFVVTLLNK